jgi:hypothetical protein
VSGRAGGRLVVFPEQALAAQIEFRSGIWGFLILIAVGVVAASISIFGG